MSTKQRGGTKWPMWKAHVYTPSFAKEMTCWEIYPHQLDAMVERAAMALANGVANKDNSPSWKDEGLRYLFRDQAKRMLRSIGLSPHRAPAPAAAKKGVGL